MLKNVGKQKTKINAKILLADLNNFHQNQNNLKSFHQNILDTKDLQLNNNKIFELVSAIDQQNKILCLYYKFEKIFLKLFVYKFLIRDTS